jgi:hypothetical protein
MSALALNPMLTVVAVPCARCGSTAATVKRDREVLEDSGLVCCEVPDTECWFCGAVVADPFWSGIRPYCSYGCAADWAA